MAPIEPVDWHSATPFPLVREPALNDLEWLAHKVPNKVRSTRPRDNFINKVVDDVLRMNFAGSHGLTWTALFDVSRMCRALVGRGGYPEF